jgi:pilus assembly protein Flp/PilA
MRTKLPKSGLWADVALLRRRVVDDERGATAIEYAIVAAGIAVAIAAAVGSLGSAVHELFARVSALF